jgi:uncharacterized membrane protein
MKNNRIRSIDILQGIVMVLVVLNNIIFHDIQNIEIVFMSLIGAFNCVINCPFTIL